MVETFYLPYLFITVLGVFGTVSCFTPENFPFDKSNEIIEMKPNFVGLYEFGQIKRSPIDRSAMVRFGRQDPEFKSDSQQIKSFDKRNPLQRSSMVRFGKRSSIERSAMVRFGKRLFSDKNSIARVARSPIERASMVRLGKRSPIEQSAMVRLG